MRIQVFEYDTLSCTRLNSKPVYDSVNLILADVSIDEAMDIMELAKKGVKVKVIEDKDNGKTR